ncbi:MAG: phage tail protein [Desulfobacteraceae bacterium]|nr:phage tail protein [Desulfobacteraceae bacterium]
MNSVKLEGLQDLQKDLDSLANEMPHVAVRALNKSMTGVKTDMVKIIRANYNYKAGAVKKRITIRKANRANISGHVQSKGGPVHLTDVTGTNQTKRGVSVNVRRDTGRKLIPRAFLAPGKNSGKIVVLRRPGKPRGQYATLYNRYGPEGSGGKPNSQAKLDWFDAAHPEILYNTEHNWAKVKDAAKDRLDTNIQRELDSELRKAAGKW